MSQTKNPGSSNFLDDRTLTLNFESKLYAGGSKDALLRQSEAQLARLSLNVTESISIFNVTSVTRSLSTKVNSPGSPRVSW